MHEFLILAIQCWSLLRSFYAQVGVRAVAAASLLLNVYVNPVAGSATKIKNFPPLSR